MNEQMVSGAVIVVGLFVLLPAILAEAAFRWVNGYSFRHWHHKHPWEDE